MFNIIVIHSDQYWKQGAESILRNLINKDVTTRVSTMFNPGIDIVLIDHASLLTLSESEWSGKAIVLVHDISPRDMLNAGEKCKNIIYSDDTPEQLSNKFLTAVKFIHTGKWSHEAKAPNLRYRLTNKEISIINDLARGIDSRVVAMMHKTTIKNVSAHKRNAMQKLNVRTTKSLLSRLSHMHENTASILLQRHVQGSVDVSTPF
ncbi:LuxR C-terminal-related transcriptional regulator [Buttiauxella sp. A111]|uniref:LuxR C-terminal-related transcriptional regulator n=1 Tax=Buttiauxella sp. A111 TaxID=2563088 RepID=UPI0010E3D9B2|nr:LuxR C-terminal-related transcriptional regulator [Buttiauxella sp. A111]GDX06247.1 hypothetical protein BSPA111_24560 [Buttiauxella sp. A111]